MILDDAGLVLVAFARELPRRLDALAKPDPWLRDRGKRHRDAVGIHLGQRAVERPRRDLRRVDETPLRGGDERRRKQVMMHVDQPALVDRRLRQQRGIRQQGAGARRRDRSQKATPRSP